MLLTRTQNSFWLRFLIHQSKGRYFGVSLFRWLELTCQTASAVLADNAVAVIPLLGYYARCSRLVGFIIRSVRLAPLSRSDSTAWSLRSLLSPSTIHHLLCAACAAQSQ